MHQSHSAKAIKGEFKEVIEFDQLLTLWAQVLSPGETSARLF